MTGIIAFLRFVAAASGAQFLVCLTAFLLSPKTALSSVIYPLTIGINLVSSVGAGVGSEILHRKDKVQTEKENQKVQKQIESKKQRRC